MMSKYNSAKIERKWQKYWKAKKLYITKDNEKGKKNFMLLTEFAYPSGNLHIGHWDAFAIPDILSRYLRMKGYNVLYPTGFDAFGLPAENAAIQRNVNPRDWTEQNIKLMTKQLKSMGTSFDWSREAQTIDPEYYKWTQWIFLKFYNKGLAYRAKTMVNWCPKDKTVLANEQVINGCCDRCGAEVVQKELTQWMFRITKYADRLYDEIDDLDWPETTKLAQKNWIGRSEGAKIKFKVESLRIKDTVEVFTTRPDTLFGATYIVLAPEHPLLQNYELRITNYNEVKEYIEKAKHKTELQRKEEAGEKTGIELKGVKAINPATKKEIPIWVADYVLGGYGTGAIMAVPSHDSRDWDFAEKYNLSKRQVIVPHFSKSQIPSPKQTQNPKTTEAYEEDGVLINSDKFSGMDSEKAKWEITEFVGGERETQYRLRDWILSRQRYWGVPIPMINCKECGFVPVPEKDLPVKSPRLDDFKPSDDGRSPLVKAEKWLKVKCPKCGNNAERETDTMDTFVDSSWYFIRYTDPKNKKEFASKEKMANWLPVPMYIGGAEHNTMHLLYSRFFVKALCDLGYLDFSEPFVGRRNHGIILGSDGQKMSKSRGNVVDPGAEVAKYGADTVRMYLAFLGPYESTMPWDPRGISGVYRFLNRAWGFVSKLEEPNREDKKADKILNKYTKEIGEDISNLKFNTAVSGLMKLLNELEDKWLTREQYGTFLKLLAPFAPHIAEELWQEVLGNKRSIHLEEWPEYNEALLAEEMVTIPIQINGKLRDTIQVKKGLSEDEVRKLVLNREKVKKYVEGKSIKKFIYIQDRLTNMVV